MELQVFLWGKSWLERLDGNVKKVSRLVGTTCRDDTLHKYLPVILDGVTGFFMNNSRVTNTLLFDDFFGINHSSLAIYSLHNQFPFVAKITVVETNLPLTTAIKTKAWIPIQRRSFINQAFI